MIKISEVNKTGTLAKNALLETNPELYFEWNFNKNNEAGLNIYKITKGSGKKVWWICPKCRSDYEALVYNRTSGQNCPYCSGKKINNSNSLASLNPELSKQWHPTKNGDLTPHDVTCNNGNKAWWIGDCGHEWEAVIASRRAGCDCPYCSNIKTLVGFNDMWTTNPKQASWLLYPEDGYKYMQNSNVRVDWKCPDCGEVIRGKITSNVKRKGLSCPNCKEGSSYPERLLYQILKKTEYKIYKEKSFNWSQGKRYDFYIPELNTIIEVHGGQHYITVPNRIRTLEEEQVNDSLKETLALKHLKCSYIIIDARVSETEYLKKSITDSRILDLFAIRNTDWSQLESLALASPVKIASEMWNNGERNLEKYSIELGVTKSTIVEYLAKGKSLGINDYTKGGFRGYSNMKKIVQLNINKQLVAKWNSIKEASISLKIPHNSISSCLIKHNKTSHGYIWMYEKDYESMIKEEYIGEIECTN